MESDPDADDPLLAIPLAAAGPEAAAPGSQAISLRVARACKRARTLARRESVEEAGSEGACLFVQLVLNSLYIIQISVVVLGTCRVSIIFVICYVCRCPRIRMV